jgi:hypothetical protein
MPSEIRLARTLSPKLMIISITRKNAVTDRAGMPGFTKPLCCDDVADDVHFLGIRSQSHFTREPADSSNDIDLFAAPFVGLVEGVIGDNPYSRRIAVGDVLQPLGD